MQFFTHRRDHALHFLFAALLFVNLFGCGASVTFTDMVPSLPPLSATINSTVHVVVSESAENIQAGVEGFGPESFGAAIEQTILNNRIFLGLRKDNDSADYWLFVEINSVTSASLADGSFVVEISATWKLISNHDQKMVWGREIRTKSRATVEESMSSGKQVAIALQRAAQQNIASALELMTRELPQPPK